MTRPLLPVFRPFMKLDEPAVEAVLLSRGGLDSERRAVVVGGRDSGAGSSLGAGGLEVLLLVWLLLEEVWERLDDELVTLGGV